ncbi:hypothetical protein [Streptomyces celluloflavus]|uniref:hypothetical protein n=1 Tax=Streptomyces celluloflavus TaxID=58344 RepID=UPI003666E828
MNARSVSRAADVIFRAMQTRQTAAGIAAALDAAGMLQSPETAAEAERLRARVAELEALELGAIDGRVSATCANSGHPTWLRATGDTRGCPWCRVAELEVRPAPAAVLRGVADEWSAQCPEHSDADEVWMSCPGEWVYELHLAADAFEAGARAEPAPVNPWERAVAGLNALVDADVIFHVEPDGHISAPFSAEHIEWDRGAERWRLVHDDETLLTAEQAEAHRLDYRARMRAAGGDLP